jgi:aminoglycoside N3'-acetyltransferase
MIRAGVRYLKRRAEALLSKPLFPIPAGEILAALRQAGVREGDHLLVHSSLKKFHQGSACPAKRKSPLEYGEELIDMFLGLTGPTGALLLPTEFMGDYTLAMLSRQTFDLASAPSNRGFLTNLFLKRQGVVRSTGPIYNVAVHGKDYEAPALSHWDHAYAMAEGTPWHRFTMNDGKIVFFGVSLDSNSLIHLPEYLMGIDYPRPVFFQKPHVFRIASPGHGTRDVQSYVHAIRWPAGTVPKFCAHLNGKYGIYATTSVHGVPITVMSSKALFQGLMSELRAGVSWYDASVW